MNTNLIHKRLRDPKTALDLQVFKKQTASEPCFLPMEIANRLGSQELVPALAANATSSHSAIEIDIAERYQLWIVDSYDPEALARLIRGLCV